MYRIEKIFLCGAVFAIGYFFAKVGISLKKKKAYLSKQDELDISRMVQEGGNPAPQQASVRQ